MPKSYALETQGAACGLNGIPEEYFGYHAEQWNRFVLTGPSELSAARVAAELGWWLHCWQWLESDSYAIVECDVPVPWQSWATFGQRRLLLAELVDSQPSG